jgi:hypothetical protein
VIQSATAAPAGSPASSIPDTRLHGHWLTLARIGWLVAVIFSLALFIGSLPAYASRLQMPCVGAVACSLNSALTSAQMRGLTSAGISVGSYAAYTIALTVGVVLIWSVVGLIIFWRRSDDWLALLVALTLILFNTGATQEAPTALALSSPAWTVPVDVVAFLTELSIGLFFMLFPGGRLVPRWTVWAVAVDLVLTAFSILPPADSPLNTNNWQLPISGLGFIGIYLVMIFSQIYRYVRVSNPLQRQQTKWVVFGVVISGVCLVGLAVSTSIPAFIQNALYALIINTMYPLALLPIPISIGVAILRYRLWDIDALINRTLVYGLLTAILGGLYAGLIIGLESLADVIKGASAQQPLVLVLSTLAIAALFRPVRNRIQLVIDRRFYRNKYDAEQTLNTFSATLQSEVDLEQVREQLLATVQQTIHPTQVSLWLRQPSQHADEQRYSVLSGERTRPLSHPHLIKNSPARW